ncbi:hypothetical protein RN001_005530 [Aquatica leii]|uniref:Protein DPCD n=1 Tax=Aquatica leii TaxID=1421715 RepID=A0AAN7SAM5_9COLE|nr:hypothetical protein RN001_005530 [Aquatica leii]
MTDWFTTLKNAKKTCIQQGNLRKVHFALPNAKEMVEEYNMDTGVVTRRAWKLKKEIGGEGDWFIEVGDPDPTVLKTDTLIKENSTQPFISRRITKKHLEWRIRNLPYPVDVYSVQVDNEKNVLIVRTNNKKYYKILNVPELERLNLPLQQTNVQFTHKFNTLIITYEKPIMLMDFEKTLFEEIRSLKARKDTEMDCKPS